MNYMEQVAHMLGVEIGEEFQIREKGGYKFKFLDSGLVSANEETEECSRNMFLPELITGDYEIVKVEPKNVKPWVPNDCQRYWFAAISALGVFFDNEQNFFYDEDVFRIRLGNCYRTREDAEADREKWERFFNSTDRINWEDK